MRTAKAFLVVPIVTWLLGLTPAHADPEYNPDTLESEPESISGGGVDLSAAPPAQKSASGIEYRTGGVGKEERDALHLAAASYPLKVVLSARADGAFVHDAQIRVTESSGKVVFEADGVGPLVYVNLPPGSYKVAATSRGETKPQNVSLDAKKQTAISFNW